MSPGLDIVAIGMVTAVGLDAPSACAAMRARLDGFRETDFTGPGGTPLIGAPIPLPRNWIGERRLAHLAAAAICEALDSAPHPAEDTALLLCLPEDGRGGPPDPARLAATIAGIVGVKSRHRTRILAHGRPAGHAALDQARRLLAEGACPQVMICGVDSCLTTPATALAATESRHLAPDHPTGFIPGEAAAAVLCTRPASGPLRLLGLGLAREKAFLYNPDDLPLRGDGMTSAFRLALDEAGIPYDAVGYCIADLIGEPFFFKETALAQTRLTRTRKEFQDLWSPAESLGNVGAAVVPLMIGQAFTAARKGYAAGNPVLIAASGDRGACGAAVFQSAASRQARAA
jgi:3-oxoacyl-[acyl-carrier-protein] synthase-1